MASGNGSHPDPLPRRRADKKEKVGLHMIPSIVIALVAAVAFVLLLSAAASTFRKVGPNQALIVYGWGGTRVVNGGGPRLFPLFSTPRNLSSQLVWFDRSPPRNPYTRPGVAGNFGAGKHAQARE